MKQKLIAASLVLLLAVPFLFGGCGGGDKGGEGFAIYLTKTNIPPASLLMLSHLETANLPFLYGGDIVSYDWSTHIIELTQGAFNRINHMIVPTSGTSFIVCVDKNPIYWGAFWTPSSSQSFDGVVIMAGNAPVNVQGVTNLIQIKLGYPGGSFYSGNDPRSNPVIKTALEKAGKLK